MKFCINHNDKKVYCKGLCRKCYEKQLIDKNPEYKIRQLENSRRWSRENPERKKEYDKKRREKVGNQTKKRFTSYLKTKFNMSYEQYEDLTNSQNNKCKICGRPPSKNKKLHLDHCHTTGKVRGLLCAQCNWYLGFIDKDYTIIEKIINYLK